MKDKRLVALCCVLALNISLLAQANLYLHDAVRANNNELIKLHIQNGANINEVDEFKQTALHLAVRKNELEIVKTLIENNATIDTNDIYGDSPIIEATRNNDTNISKELICNGANMNVKGQFGLTPLNYSTMNNNLNISKLIFSKELKKDCEEFDKPQDNNITSLENNDTNQSENLIMDNELELLKGEDNTSIQTPSSDLVNAINTEFQNDYINYFDAKTLTFNFTSDDYYFENGSLALRESFKQLLNNFIPRLAKVLNNFPNDIQKVVFKGSSSPKYDSIDDEVLKYEKNMELSHKRANNVLEYLNTSEALQSNSDYLSLKEKVKIDAIVDDSVYSDEAMARRVEIILNK